MFTGLVEEIGTIAGLEKSGDGVRVTIEASVVLDDISHGDSINVAGTCLSAIGFTPSSFAAEAMKETLDHSAAGKWEVGTRVNLERAATLGSRLGGHIVQGHVDATAEVLQITPGDKWSVIRFSLIPDIAPLVAHKGSLTLSGVSLTVSALGTDWAEVSLIPETLVATTLGSLKVAESINLETDIVARHVMRLHEFTKGDGPS